MAHGGRVDRTSRPRTRAATVVVPLPRRAEAGRVEVGRLLPGSRALLVGVLVALVALVAYLLSTVTSLFAVQSVTVSGASPAIAADVRAALAEARGTSLVGIDLDRLAGLVEVLPTVAAVSFDRAFPHTLEVHVVPERVVAVVRQGKQTFTVSAHGRVVGSIARSAAGSLPRIWAPRTEALVVGATVPPSLLPAVKTVSPLRRVTFPARVTAVRTTDGNLTLRLASGLEVRLGSPQEVTLKLAVAGRILPLLADDATYLDVSVPERPVAGDDSVTAAGAAVPSVTAGATSLEAGSGVGAIAPTEAVAAAGVSTEASTDAAVTASGSPVQLVQSQPEVEIQGSTMP